MDQSQRPRSTRCLTLGPSNSLVNSIAPWELFCGEEVFQHKLTFDRSSLTRWRQRMGEQRLTGG